jgi:hypothetical protein
MTTDVAPTATVAEPKVPTGAEEWEHYEFLDGEGPEWVAGLQAQHRAAVAEWAKGVADLATVRERHEAEDKAHRAAVADAIVNGTEPPRREPDDRTVRDVQLEVLDDVADEKREQLAEVTIACLRELRLNLHELETTGATFRPALAHSLRRGPGGWRAQRRAVLEKQMEAMHGEIVNIDEQEPEEEEVSRERV